MSVGVITIAKLLGPSSICVRTLLRSWRPASQPNGSATNPVSESGVPGANSIEQLLELIERSAIAPPVVYFERYVDPWTIAPHRLPVIDLMSTTLKVDEYDDERYSVRLFSMQDSDSLEARIRSLLHALESGDAVEEYKLTNSIYVCLRSWKVLAKDAGLDSAILMAVKAVGGSWLDEEVVDGCRGVPSWLTG